MVSIFDRLSVTSSNERPSQLLSSSLTLTRVLRLLPSNKRLKTIRDPITDRNAMNGVVQIVSSFTFEEESFVAPDIAGRTFMSFGSVGDKDGVDDGRAVGFRDGFTDGMDDGMRVGILVGVADGDNDGSAVGVVDGLSDGCIDGNVDGLVDGFAVGTTDGRDEGYTVGSAVGVMDGLSDGVIDGIDDGAFEG